MYGCLLQHTGSFRICSHTQGSSNEHQWEACLRDSADRNKENYPEQRRAKMLQQRQSAP